MSLFLSKLSHSRQRLVILLWYDEGNEGGWDDEHSGDSGFM